MFFRISMRKMAMFILSLPVRILESLRQHLPGAIWGGLVGAIIALGVFIWQVHWQENKARVNRTLHWSRSVIEEFRDNDNLGVDSPHLIKNNNHTYYLRYLSNSALSSFLDQAPNLSINDNTIFDSARVLFELTITINQLVDQRNLQKTYESGGFRLGSTRERMENLIDTLVARYRECGQGLVNKLAE